MPKNKTHFVIQIFGWALVIAAFIGTFATCEDSIAHNIKLNSSVNKLEKERDKYQQKINETQIEMKNFQEDRNQLERLAREKYYMRCDNEDVFIIKNAND